MMDNNNIIGNQAPSPREGNGVGSKVVIELQNVKRYFQVGSETVKVTR